MDKKKIDEVLQEFGIVATHPKSEFKYSDQMYRHFEMMAEAFEVKEPCEVLAALLENNIKPYATQYVLYGQPHGDGFQYTICFPKSFKEYDYASFMGPVQLNEPLLNYFAEQALYTIHKEYVDAKAPIPVQGLFHTPPQDSEGAVMNLVIDANYTVRAHLHNVNVEHDSRPTIH